MSNYPRIAIGSIQDGADHRLATWGVMALLARSGLDVQPYLPQSHFRPSAAALLTGHDQRHLDTWQMPQSVCRQILTASSPHSDMAIVEGRFGDEREGGGSLERLCRWLQIPRIGVLDTRQLKRCRFPDDIRDLDGLVLDFVADAQEAARWAVELETLFGVRILGWLPELPALRGVVANLDRGTSPSIRFCDALAGAIKPRMRADLLLQKANQAPQLDDAPQELRDENPATIALAFDEAFQRYFPDTLDRMEAVGARIRTFSPLRAETLPNDADVVIFGCGDLAPFGEQLARNRCLHHALWEHKKAGKRIYGEGAGAAFLCRHLVLPSGRRFAMSGLLDANAELLPGRPGAQPVEQRWRSPLWTGGGFANIRGYRNLSWRFSIGANGTGDAGTGDEPASPRPLDTLAEASVIASRVHVNFAAHSELLSDFVHRDCPAVVSEQG